jgi:murein DD-endopeptidase MepM/ murein hydrolase activator NlpD
VALALALLWGAQGQAQEALQWASATQPPSDAASLERELARLEEQTRREARALLKAQAKRRVTSAFLWGELEAQDRHVALLERVVRRRAEDLGALRARLQELKGAPRIASATPEPQPTKPAPQPTAVSPTAAAPTVVSPTVVSPTAVSPTAVSPTVAAPAPVVLGEVYGPTPAPQDAPTVVDLGEEEVTTPYAVAPTHDEEPSADVEPREVVAVLPGTEGSAVGASLGGAPRAPAVPGEVRRGELLMPLLKGTVKARFGPVKSKLSGTWVRHTGWTLTANPGNRIRSVSEGTVVYAKGFKGYGLLVVIDHGGGYHSVYAHLRTILVKPGSRVEKGTPLGVIGATGSLTGEKLYFELRQDGRPIDPEGWFAPVEPK